MSEKKNDNVILWVKCKPTPRIVDFFWVIHVTTMNYSGTTVKFWTCHEEVKSGHFSPVMNMMQDTDIVGFITMKKFF